MDLSIYIKYVIGDVVKYGYEGDYLYSTIESVIIHAMQYNDYNISYRLANSQSVFESDIKCRVVEEV